MRAEIGDVINEDACEEHQELIKTVKNTRDGALAELRKSTIFSYIK